MIRIQKLFIEGRWCDSKDIREIRSPFDDSVVSNTHYATPQQMEQALAASARAFRSYRRISRSTRSRLLTQMRLGIEARRDEFVRLLVEEAGKPISAAEAEVGRALNTFQIAAEEARRFVGELLPMDIDPVGRDFEETAVVHWVPRGPVLGITPFNFPLNLVAHKVAPALAAGVSILIKPAPQAPGAAVLLAQVFEEAARTASDAKETIDLATFQVVSCSNEVAAQAVADPRMTILTFTGSGPVGWALQRAATGKKVTLELGGNAAVIIHDDADLTRAVSRCVAGGFGYAGQSCISVQRILVHQNIAAEFEKRIVAETGKLKCGDPREKSVTVGPVIDQRAADRLESWIQDAISQGAQCLIGGGRTKNLIQPTILKGMKHKSSIYCEEAFGPVVLLETYDQFSAAIQTVNDSQYGLQAGVFTSDERRIRQAIEELEVGAVLINEVPTYRADQQPYGGMKGSGLGREGVRYTMQEFSETKTVMRFKA